MSAREQIMYLKTGHCDQEEEDEILPAVSAATSRAVSPYLAYSVGTRDTPLS